MRFSVAYPNGKRSAARPFKTSPMYDLFSGMNAVWGRQYGLEVVNYFTLPGKRTCETPTFKRSNAWDASNAEVAIVRTAVGIGELSNFGKCRVTGPRAREWFDRIMAGTIPQPSRLALSPMLARLGRITGDFTVSCLSGTEFMLTASYGAQGWHLRRFDAHWDDGVRVENVSDARSGFQIAGPTPQSCWTERLAATWRRSA